MNIIEYIFILNYLNAHFNFFYFHIFNEDFLFKRYLIFILGGLNLQFQIIIFLS